MNTRALSEEVAALCVCAEASPCVFLKTVKATFACVSWPVTLFYKFLLSELRTRNVGYPKVRDVFELSNRFGSVSLFSYKRYMNI